MILSNKKLKIIVKIKNKKESLRVRAKKALATIRNDNLFKIKLDFNFHSLCNKVSILLNPKIYLSHL